MEHHDATATAALPTTTGEALVETALHHMRKVIEWVAENYTPHQAEDIRGRLRQGSADEITQWFQASINVISPVNSQEPPTHHNVGGEYERGEGGADPNDEGADWGDNTDGEDTTVGPCETPSATTTRDRSGKPWNEEDEKNTRATETKGAGHFEDDILGEHDARPCATPSASKKDDTKGTGDLVDDTLREHTKKPCETPSASKEKPTPPGQEERRGGYRARQSSQRRERPHGEQKANKPKGEDTREHRRDEPQQPRRDEDEYEEVAVDPEDVTKAETENSGGTATGRLRPAEPQHPPRKPWWRLQASPLQSIVSSPTTWESLQRQARCQAQSSACEHGRGTNRDYPAGAHPTPQKPPTWGKPGRPCETPSASRAKQYRGNYEGESRSTTTTRRSPTTTRRPHTVYGGPCERPSARREESQHHDRPPLPRKRRLDRAGGDSSRSSENLEDQIKRLANRTTK